MVDFNTFVVSKTPRRPTKNFKNGICLKHLMYSIALKHYAFQLVFLWKTTKVEIENKIKTLRKSWMWLLSPKLNTLKAQFSTEIFQSLETFPGSHFLVSIYTGGAEKKVIREAECGCRWRIRKVQLFFHDMVGKLATTWGYYEKFTSKHRNLSGNSKKLER